MYHNTTRPSSPETPNLGPSNPGPSNLGPTNAAVSSNERGQATAEYALVMLAAAAIAGLLLAWAASTGSIDRLLDAVIDTIIDQTG